MPRRNRRFRRALNAPRRERTLRTLYFRDACGKLRFPSFRAAVRLAGRADAEYGPDNGHHTVYRCRWYGGWHLSSRTPSEVDARRAYYHNQREEATR